MGRGLNKVMIIGLVGREPEMRYTPSGRPVTSFSVATSRSWTSADGERREETEWFNVVAWGNLAEICKIAPDQESAGLCRGPSADAWLGRRKRQEALPHRARRQRDDSVGGPAPFAPRV
jgi:primosomal replication protein N